MMGHRQVEQVALFYEFSLERHIPGDHLLRSIDRFVDLDQLRRELAGFYSRIGRPSIDPELMIRMLIIGYCFGVRSERRLREEVHLNLAYRGSAGSGSMAKSPITPPSPRTGMVASVRGVGRTDQFGDRSALPPKAGICRADIKVSRYPQKTPSRLPHLRANFRH